MEHQYLKPIPKVPNDKYGDKGRAAERRRREVLAMRLADRFIATELPSLLEEPPKLLPSVEIVDASSHLFEVLAESTGCHGELAAGYNRFCDFIDAGNEAGAWSYPAIAKLHQLPTQALLRDAEWHRDAIDMHKLDLGLQRAIAEATPSDLEDAETLISLLIVYAATLSGICTSGALKALALSAFNGPEVFRSVEPDEAWILLRIEDANVTNVCVGEERLRIERHLLDPITLSLLNRISKLELDEGPPEIELLPMIRMVNDTAERLGLKRSSLPSIKQLGRVALSIEEQYTPIPHALLCAQAGVIPTVCLSERHWREMLWLDPPKQDDLDEPALRLDTNAISPPVVQDGGNANSSISTMSSALLMAIRKPKGRKDDRAKTLKNLKAIDAATWPLGGRLLCAYYQYHLSIKGNAVSTVRTYHSEIGRRLLKAMEGRDAFDADDIDAAYRAVINDEPSDKQQIRAAARLTELHHVGRSLFGLPALYEPLVSGVTAKRHVRAAFVCERVFERFLLALQSADLEAGFIECVAVISIIAYRTGMRPDDIVGLQVQDIEPGKWMTIKVRNNALSTGKTENAVRIIPLGLLLTRDENRLVRDFINRRRRRNRNRPTAALFNTEGSETQAVVRSQVSNVVIGTLKAIGHPGVLYDFRHTALCRLFLIGERQWELLDRVTPYSRKQQEAICKAVFGSAYEWSERYRALAALAGHGGPEITFDYYVHFSSWVVHRALRASTRTFDVRFLANITGIGATVLRRGASVVGTQDARLRLEDIRATALEHNRRIITTLGSRPIPSKKAKGISKIPSPSPTLWDVHGAFTDWEHGYSPKTIAFEYGFRRESFERMLSVAKSLASVMTRKNTPRLVSSNRKARKRDRVLPSLLTSVPLRMDAEILVRRFKAMYINAGKEQSSGPSRRDIAWAILHWLLNTTTHEPYARFVSRKELRRFLKIVSGAIPDNRWRIEIMVGKGQSVAEQYRFWSMPSRFDVVLMEGKRSAASSEAHVHLKHPTDKEMVEKMQKTLQRSKNRTRQYIVQKYTAHTLRFVFHMMAIVMLPPQLLEQYIEDRQ